MKIKMKSLLAGPGGVMLSGCTYEVNEAFGESLVEQGYAERIGRPAPMPEEPQAPPEEPQAVETASIEPPSEKAVGTPARAAKAGKGKKPKQSSQSFPG